MNRLQQNLLRIDGNGYKAYKQIAGIYHGAWFHLHIDHVQSDPYAPPSRIRVIFARKITPIKQAYITTASRQVALADFITRSIARTIRQQKSPIHIDLPSQEMMLNTSFAMDEQQLEVRLSANLPAAGRRILGRQAISLLCEQIPQCIKQTIEQLDIQRLEQQLQLADQQDAIRTYLQEHHYVSFIANGAILPRQSGVSDQPLTKERAIPFQSPPEWEIEIPIPHRKPIRGMGIPKGVTLIVGGGYHGKSTLLQAIERGVYNHIPGDGREYVITDETACKIRAEDGRRVAEVNISPFISNLPFSQNTSHFSSENASGSTSQAANIIEAVEMGTQLLLVDEDTSATNFMIRDARMQKLISKEKEPITPFIDQVKLLYEQCGISTILVIGGSGDYLEVADTVIMMDEYKARDVTQTAKSISRELVSKRKKEAERNFHDLQPRFILPESIRATYKGKRDKALGLHTIQYGKKTLNLAAVEQLVHPSQTRSIVLMIQWLAKNWKQPIPLCEAIDELYQLIQKQGLEVISPYPDQHPGDLALPRKFELAAVINRLHSIKISTNQLRKVVVNDYD